VLAAIAVVAELSRRGDWLQHAIEVAAFGGEEGSRFPAHILTSSALLGAVGPELMDSRDKDGISVPEAVAAAGGNAVTAASEMVLAIERLASSEKALVATVGQIAAPPGAQNVIPGKVRFTIDMRRRSDADRDRPIGLAHRAVRNRRPPRR
jgi:hypothetical protein